MILWTALRNFVESKNILKLNTYLKESSKAIIANSKSITSKGDVKGPVSSTDGEVVVFNKTTGKVIKGSVVQATSNGLMIDSESGEKGLRMGGAGNVSFVGRYSNYMSLYNHLNTSKEFKIPDSGDPTIGGKKVWHEGNDAALMKEMGQLPSNADFNNYTEMGVWYIGNASGMSNDPNVSWATLVVIKPWYYCKQTVFNSNGTLKYERYRNTNTWTPWAAY